jgi:hypothetical protein
LSAAELAVEHAHLDRPDVRHALELSVTRTSRVLSKPAAMRPSGRNAMRRRSGCGSVSSDQFFTEVEIVTVP